MLTLSVDIVSNGIVIAPLASEIDGINPNRSLQFVQIGESWCHVDNDEMYKCGVDLDAGLPAKNAEKFTASVNCPRRSGHSFPYKCIKIILVGGSCVCPYHLKPGFSILQ